MPESGVAFSDEFNQALNERGRVWDTLDNAHYESNQIAEKGAKIKEVGTPEPITALTRIANPPEELHATLLALDAELKRIEQNEGAIQANETRIAQIKKEIQNRWSMFIAGVVIFGLIFLYMFFQVIF